ncbi:MAG: hypothetical protein M0Z43_02280 [Acidithiobacillus sp.]|nr:hypothetical protein [Acidithiobacillus sp.]
MIEGKWYRCVESSARTEEGKFYKLLQNDGTGIFRYATESGSMWVWNEYFDLTRPYDSPPRKENNMIEGKWYKCTESGSGVEKGRYYECVDDNDGDALVGMEHAYVSVFRRRFDPTPHDKTVFPNAPDLIKRVRRIDPAAAEWLEFGDHSGVTNFRSDKTNLDDMMLWSSTPQGRRYWERIHDAVDYEEEETPTLKDEFKKGERVEVRDDEDEDWEPATFLCVDEDADAELKYVVRNMHDYPDGFKFCRRSAPKRPYIEPGTPIEVWNNDAEYSKLRRFGCWTGRVAWVVRDSDAVEWKHCRVLVPNGVEV